MASDLFDSIVARNRLTNDRTQVKPPNLDLSGTRAQGFSIVALSSQINKDGRYLPAESRLQARPPPAEAGRSTSGVGHLLGEGVFGAHGTVLYTVSCR